MDSKLFQEINDKTNLIKELCETLDMKKEDIPQELLDEIVGMSAVDPSGMGGESAAKARAGERDWIADLKGQEPAQTAYHGREGGPRALPPGGAGEQATPQPGDFVKVGNELKKVSKIENKFGNDFAFFGPNEKPAMLMHLKLDKEIGGKRVYVPVQ